MNMTVILYHHALIHCGNDSAIDATGRVLRRRYLPVDAWATFDGWTAGLPSWDIEGRSVSSVSGVTPSLFSSL
jgi:hypothetical protein